jgi:hypothetical protein
MAAISDRLQLFYGPSSSQCLLRSMAWLSIPGEEANRSQPQLWTMVESGLEISESGGRCMTGYEK